MKLTVNLPNREYDLWIERGNLQDVGTWLSDLWQPQQVVIISDKTVASLYGDLVQDKLAEAGFNVSLFAIEPGEASKSLSNAEWLYGELAKKGMTRSDGVVVLGGGVVGDLGAFVASTYMRGLHFVQIPTTLLAQVDSSIGGKTAVNTRHAKNLVGTFAQPDGVLIDVETLNTLDERRISEGIAEIVKSAAIADKNLWDKLEKFRNSRELLDDAVAVIHACCAVKKTVVEEDELDNGIRLILNFGHTIGHGIENTYGYGVVTHGEAVSLGMIRISQAAEQKGLMPKGVTEHLAGMLEKFDLPVTLADWQPEAVFQAITHDKKTRGSQIKLILLEEIGTAKIVTLPLVEVKDFLE